MFGYNGGQVAAGARQVASPAAEPQYINDNDNEDK